MLSLKIRALSKVFPVSDKGSLFIIAYKFHDVLIALVLAILIVISLVLGQITGFLLIAFSSNSIVVGTDSIVSMPLYTIVIVLELYIGLFASFVIIDISVLSGGVFSRFSELLPFSSAKTTSDFSLMILTVNY